MSKEALPTTGIPKLDLGPLFEPIYRTGREGVPLFRMLLGGQWVSGPDGRTFEIDTPIDNSLIARAPQASPEDVTKAIEIAATNQSSIRDIPGIERTEIFERARQVLLEHKDELIRTLMLEAGKPRKDAEGEVKAVAERLKLTLEEARKIFGEYIPGDWSDDTAGKFALVIREPLGVVVAISPFNYPVFIAAAKIIPALLAGNSVVAKGASEDPLSLLLFARILQAAGIPAGALNVVTGSGPALGEALVKDDRVSVVTFTGSTQTGKWVTERVGVKKLHLELGGKGMAVVLDDADLDLAAAKCVEGALKNAGQRCDAISAVLVVEAVAAPFIEKLRAQVDSWTWGNPFAGTVKMGPLINRHAAEWVHTLVQDAVGKGAKLLRGGQLHECYYEPTLLDNVPLDARIANEETFGPVVTVIRIPSEDAAIEIGRRSRYGLDSCVFTTNFYRMWRLAKRLKTGEVTINDLPRHGVGYFPFGGEKESGIGREGIGYSIDEMTTIKTVVFNLEPAGLGKMRKEHG
jgi:glyceraldehyde-3-phosphate dehydrogenase [NAD(P)+]